MVISIIIFGLLLAIFGWMLPVTINSKIATAWGSVNLFLLKIICNLNYSIEGYENIPESSCIIMSKHQSTWETIALRGLLPFNQSWVLKRELMFIPIFGWALAVDNSIAINRSSGKEAINQIITKGKQRLDQNYNVIIFPEGTRVAPGERKRYGIGGGLLAEKTNYPVIPIAHNAGIFWRRRGLNKYPGTIQVVIGKPISTKGKKASEITKEVEDWIENKVSELPNMT